MDRGGFWQNPFYYPERVRFAPVTSVPYWDERCGRKFTDFPGFAGEWHEFWSGVTASVFDSRSYIIENLSLEGCAQEYVAIAGRVEMGSGR